MKLLTGNFVYPSQKALDAGSLSLMFMLLVSSQVALEAKDLYSSVAWYAAFHCT